MNAFGKSQILINKKVLMAECMPFVYEVQVGSHWYARNFLRSGNKVFFLAYYVNPFTFLKRKHGAKIMCSSWRNGVISPEENLYTYTPLSLLPYSSYPLLSSELTAFHTLKFTVPSLLNLLKRYTFDEVDILWLTNPTMISIKNMVRYKILVYRMCDNHARAPRLPSSIGNIERIILEEANIVFATSKNLMEKAKKLNSNVYYLPNGVDLEYFAYKKLKAPKEFGSISSPRIIYVGAISRWLDIDLLEFTASRLKNFSFVLIGPTDINLSRLKNKNNIFILGPRYFKDVPAYLQNSNVGIIPFKRNTFTNSINLIKLYEYFASGLPVVSTNLKGVRSINSPAMLADSQEDFVDLILEAVNSGKDKEEFRNFAQENSWHKRFEYVQRVVEEEFR